GVENEPAAVRVGERLHELVGAAVVLGPVARVASGAKRVKEVEAVAAVAVPRERQEVRGRVRHADDSNHDEKQQVQLHAGSDKQRSRRGLGERTSERESDLCADAEAGVNERQPGGSVAGGARVQLELEPAGPRPPASRRRTNPNGDKSL